MTAVEADAYTRNSSGDEIPKRDVNPPRYVASVLIAHTDVASSSSPCRHGEYKRPRCSSSKMGSRNPIRGHPRGFSVMPLDSMDMISY